MLTCNFLMRPITVGLGHRQSNNQKSGGDRRHGVHGVGFVVQCTQYTYLLDCYDCDAIMDHVKAKKQDMGSLFVPFLFNVVPSTTRPTDSLRESQCNRADLPPRLSLFGPTGKPCLDARTATRFGLEALFFPSPLHSGMEIAAPSGMTARGELAL